MKSAEVTVWNASKGVVLVGKDRIALKPAQKVTVVSDESVSALIASGKLIAVNASRHVEAESADSSAKKKKKSSQATDVESVTPTEEPVAEPAEESAPEISEVTEDSILAEETF